jgi:polysaccharide transporter, PST family
MNLARTTLLNGLATATRLGCGLVLNKLLALHVGPAGFAVVGQFQSLLAMAGALGGGALGNGVTKLTAEHAGAPQRQLAAWRTALWIALAASAFVALVLLVLARPLAAALLGDAELAPALRWLALCLVAVVANALLLALLSGLKLVRRFVAASVCGSLLGLALAVPLIRSGGLAGALAATAAAQAVALVATLAAAWPALRGQLRALGAGIDRPAARALGGFALMAATTAIAVPLAQIAIREGLVQLHGSQTAGLWQAMARLSDTHLLLLTTTLSLYFLPRFAGIRLGPELLAEVRAGYRFVLPLTLCSALLIWLLREPLVALLFSREFVPLTEAMAWQLTGDVLKIASWVPAFTMISHARTRLFITTEIGFAVAVAAATLLGAAYAGLRGAAFGYAAVYALYWLVMQHQLHRLCARLGSGSRPALGPAA